ncbi:MAG: prephenate dehydrogenase [Lachnospiraceae bacterium]|nr:prephenate dehydrogenase [Lachnospiraceae bacterium]
MRKTAIIGLGLIGGSIAKTIKRKHPEITVVACNRSEKALKSALSEGAADIVTRSVDENFSDCDLIFLCAPVETNLSFLPALKPYLKESTVLTDAGSVKGIIHSGVSAALPGAHFIGGHPMAGSEKSGYENSTDRLFENAYYLLTPGENVSDEETESLKQFIASLDAIPLVLSPAEHDHVTAAVSHVPHLAAYALVKLIADSDSPEEYMKRIAAGGFRDITRIASSDPTMWEQISLENRERISALLKTYINSLSGILELVERGDGEKLHKLFSDAKDYRDSMTLTSPGRGQRIFDFFCDIVDETGAINNVTAILFENCISIKNLSIVHNRSFEKGVLHIECYDEPGRDRAIEVLKLHSYKVYIFDK